MKTESISNSGIVLHTDYTYDMQGRIIEIIQYENDPATSTTTKIDYVGSDVILSRDPNTEPAYDQTEKIQLFVDGSGKVVKRIQFTHGISKSSTTNPAETFKFDTASYEYDNAGLLMATKERRYDSIYIEANSNAVTRLSSLATYTNQHGNLVGSHEIATYFTVTKQGSATDTTGGSSEYVQTFSYSDSFPNSADFSNASVLNEFKLYYESPLNVAYQNMPGRVIRNSQDKDLKGTIIFTGTSTIAMERDYGTDGLLSIIHVPTLNTPFKMISFFYGR